MRRLFFPIALGLLCAPTLRGGEGPVKPVGKKIDLLGDPLPAGVAARLGTVRLRHTGPIYTTAWAPDGKMLASGGLDDFIRLWDPATGKEIRQIKGVAGFIALVFFKDGKTIASADLQGYIRLWDIESGRELRRLGNPKDRVTSLALSPDNRTLFSAGSERIVRQWLVAVGVELRQFPVHPGAILTLAVAADGKELRTAADDGLARVFNTSTGLEARTFAIDNIRGGFAQLATFSRGGHVLATTRADGALSLYDADDGKPLRTFGGPTMRPNALDFSPNGKFIAATFFTGGVRVFGVASGQEMRAFDNPSTGRSALAFAPDGQTLVATSGDQSLRLWHVADAREVLPLPGHRSAVHSLCFSRDGTLLFTASNDRAIRVWDRVTGKELAQFEPKFGFLQQVSVGTGPRSFFTLGLEGGLEWSLKDNKEIIQFRKWDQLKSLSNMAASPDGKVVALAGTDPAISVLDAASGKILIKLGESKEGAPGKVVFRTTSLAFSPDGKLLAATGITGPVQVWNVATGRLVRQFGQGRGGAIRLAFSPDSKLLAVGDLDVKLYEVATGQERLQLAQFIGVRALAFSPDGRYLVAGLSKGGVQYIEAATGMPAEQRGDSVGEVRALAISPDGATLASAGADTSVMLWAKPLWREPARPIAPLRLEPAEVEILWKTLAQPDGLRAHQAIWALAGAPAQSVPFLKGKIKAADPVQPKKVDQYIRDLDSSNFEVRRNAMRELEKLGDQVEQALNDALKNSPSVETRRRMEQILAGVKDYPPDKLQMLRALEVLEHAATDEARHILAALAVGGTGHWLTEHARQAQQRLERGKALP